MTKRPSKKLTIQQILDAIVKLTREFQNHLAKTRKELYQHLQTAAELELQLRQNQNAWRQFTKLDFWKDQKSKPLFREQKNALHFLLKHMFGTDRGFQSRCNKYKNAIWVLLKEGVQRKNIAKEIEIRGGIKKLSDQWPKKKRSKDPEKGKQKNSGSQTLQVNADPKKVLIVEMGSKAIDGLHRWGARNDFKLVLQLTVCNKKQVLKAKVVDCDGLDQSW